MALVLHRNVALLDVSLSTNIVPAQSVVSLPKCTTGGVFWVRIIVSRLTPHRSESWPQYKPGVDTEIEDVLSPVLHL